jgi:hypothetical protein
MAAYIVVILRKFQAQLVAERAEKQRTERAGTEEMQDEPEYEDKIGSPGDAVKVGEFEVPFKVSVGQLTDPDANREFICRICSDVCDDAILLPCSHVFCSNCIKQVSMQKGNLCPTCRKPFESAQVSKVPWLTRWINNIHICCAFANPSDLKTPSVDPLPAGHAARKQRLCCDWTGPISNYRAHQAQTCQVAARLREQQKMQRLSDSASIPHQAGLHRKPNGRIELVDSTPQKFSVLATSYQMESPDKCERPRSKGNPYVAGASAPISNVEPGKSQSPVKQRNGDPPQRRKVIAAFSPTSTSSTLRLTVGDWIEVETIDPSGWTYGSKLAPTGAPLDSGWFPAWAIGLDVSGSDH